MTGSHFTVLKNVETYRRLRQSLGLLVRGMPGHCTEGKASW